MTTARDLIQDAMEMLGVFAPGEVIDAADADRMLFVLNSLLDELAAESIYINGMTDLTTMLQTAKPAYTVGLNGADITTRRPLTVAYGQSSGSVSSPGRGIGYAVNDTGYVLTGSSDASYIITKVAHGGAVAGYALTNMGTAYATTSPSPTIAGGSQPGSGNGFVLSIAASGGPIQASAFVGSVIGAPIDIVSMIEFQSLKAYDPPSGQPDTVWYKPSYPLGVIHVLPAPSSSLNLTVSAWSRIVGFPTLDSGYELSVGVLDALRDNLAAAAKTYFRDAQIDPMILQSATVSRTFLRYQSLTSRAMMNRFVVATNPQKPQ